MIQYFCYLFLIYFIQINCTEKKIKLDDTKQAEINIINFLKVQIRIYRNINNIARKATCSCEYHTINRYFEFDSNTRLADLIPSIQDICSKYETKNKKNYKEQIGTSTTDDYKQYIFYRHLLLNIFFTNIKFKYYSDEIDKNLKIADFKNCITNDNTDYDFTKFAFIVCDITANYNNLWKKSCKKIFYNHSLNVEHIEQVDI